MKRLFLACLCVMAVTATFVPPSQAVEQSAFHIEQEIPNYASDSAQGPSSNLDGILLCGVTMRATGYRDKCAINGKDAYVCKNDSDGNAVMCDVYEVPFDDNYFGDSDCDHILDLQIFVRALERAFFCEDMNYIRAHDKFNIIGTNEKYLRGLRTAANEADAVNYFDRYIHGFKSYIIDLAVNGGTVVIKKPALWCAVFLETYHNKAFSPKGKVVAGILDRLAYEALQEMVDDIQDDEHKEKAQEYLDGRAWKTKTYVSDAHNAASVKWVAVQAPWLEIE